MKKKPLMRTTPFWSVNLYRDDVEELLNILHENQYTATIGDSKNSYESLDELREQKGSQVSEFAIEGFGSEAEFQLKISPIGNFLTVTNGDSLFFQVKEFLKAHTRKGLGSAIVGFLVAIITMALLAGFYDHRTTFIIVMFSIIVPTLLLGMFMRGVLSVIHLSKKHEQLSFWKENKNSVWLVIITAFITGIVSVAVSYFLFKSGIK